MIAQSGTGRPSQQIKRRGKLRFVLRCCALVAAVILVLQVLPWPRSAMILPALSPYVAICSAIAVRSVSAATLLGLPVLLMILWRRRAFCRYACPMGLLMEQVGRLRPSAESGCEKLPPIGQWVVLLTLGGACVGYPLLLWMDPLAVFTSFFGLIRQPPVLVGLFSAAGFLAVAVLRLLLPGAWCTRICPLGATQDLLAAAKKGVGGLLGNRSGGTQHVGLEKDVCGFPKGSSSAERNGWLLGRRAVLSMGLGAAWAAITLKDVRADEPAPIRPPGSADEDRFAGLCVRCGNCVRACPAGIIRPDLGQSGVAGFLTPVIRFEKDYCREDCRQCTAVCPSGAIGQLSPEQKREASIGLATVDMSVCLLKDDRECSACVTYCPFDAVKIEFNEEDYTSTPRVDAAKCPGCGACEVACPTYPTKAIRVVGVC